MKNKTTDISAQITAIIREACVKVSEAKAIITANATILKANLSTVETVVKSLPTEEKASAKFLLKSCGIVATAKAETQERFTKLLDIFEDICSECEDNSDLEQLLVLAKEMPKTADKHGFVFTVTVEN